MTEQSSNSNLHEQTPSVQTTDLASRMARLIGAWRARRATDLQTTAPMQADDASEPPIEWALRLMM